jgi:hypothetical protein
MCNGGFTAVSELSTCSQQPGSTLSAEDQGRVALAVYTKPCPAYCHVKSRERLYMRTPRMGALTGFGDMGSIDGIILTSAIALEWVSM